MTEPGTTEPPKRKRHRPDAETQRKEAAERRLRRATLERQAVELRIAGRTFEQIAGDLGFVTRSAAYKAYQSAMNRMVAEPVEELRALATQRLETLRFAHWTRALAGDVAASVMVLRIEKQLADLHGLNAPKEIDLRLEAREIASRYGLDEDEVMAEAMRWLAGSR